MRGRFIGMALVVIGFLLGIFFVVTFISLSDALPEYRAGLAAGLVPGNSLTPDEWLNSKRIPLIMFLILSLLLVIAGCLVALGSRLAPAVSLGAAMYAVISYVFVVRFSTEYGGVDFVVILFLLLILLGVATFVSLKPAK